MAKKNQTGGGTGSARRSPARGSRRRGARSEEPPRPGSAGEYVVGPLPDHLERLRERLKRQHR
jgi:hypothetical protein